MRKSGVAVEVTCLVAAILLALTSQCAANPMWHNTTDGMDVEHEHPMMSSQNDTKHVASSNVSHHSMHHTTHSPTGGHHPMDHDKNNEMNHNTHHPTGHGVYFAFGVDTVILFRQWTTDDWRSMLGSCFGVVAIAVAYELLKSLRDHMYVYARRMERYNLYKLSLAERCTCGAVCMHLLQTLMHMLLAFLSLCLMLVFMTFNVWLCIAVVGGAGLGYLIIGWKRRCTMLDEENCH